MTRPEVLEVALDESASGGHECEDLRTLPYTAVGLMTPNT